MIKRKQKPCAECKVPSYLFSKGLCRACWQKKYGKAIKKQQTEIKRQSGKGKEREAKYNTAREVYLSEHNSCERCGTREKLEIHHKKGRDGKNRYNYFMTVCRPCHTWIHDNVEESYGLGYLLSRLTN